MSRVAARPKESQHHNQDAHTNNQDRAPFLFWNVQLPITLYTMIKQCDVNTA